MEINLIPQVSLSSLLTDQAEPPMDTETTYVPTAEFERNSSARPDILRCKHFGQSVTHCWRASPYASKSSGWWQLHARQFTQPVDKSLLEIWIGGFTGWLLLP
jgi:hypothetical protein